MLRHLHRALTSPNHGGYKAYPCELNKKRSFVSRYVMTCSIDTISAGCPKPWKITAPMGTKTQGSQELVSY